MNFNQKGIGLLIVSLQARRNPVAREATVALAIEILCHQLSPLEEGEQTGDRQRLEDIVKAGLDC